MSVRIITWRPCCIDLNRITYRLSRHCPHVYFTEWGNLGTGIYSSHLSKYFWECLDKTRNKRLQPQGSWLGFCLWLWALLEGKQTCFLVGASVIACTFGDVQCVRWFISTSALTYEGWFWPTRARCCGALFVGAARVLAPRVPGWNIKKDSTDLVTQQSLQ